MTDFHGMRWFKCDLQMQTPSDASHWRGAPMGTSLPEQEAAAETYIRRCYEVGLEVIAITDHNFLSKGFIPLLQAAIHKMTGEFGYRMVLFPGFEFEADVGKGVHVLGDAIQAGPYMPKSAHMANAHAKVAAAAIVAKLSDFSPNPNPWLTNTCYSFVDPSKAIYIASVHQYDEADRTFKILPNAGGISGSANEEEGKYAYGWAKNIWADSLG